MELRSQTARESRKSGYSRHRNGRAVAHQHDGNVQGDPVVTSGDIYAPGKQQGRDKAKGVPHRGEPEEEGAG